MGKAYQNRITEVENEKKEKSTKNLIEEINWLQNKFFAILWLRSHLF